MAFLCPSRAASKDKRKKRALEPLFGRITGSDSVDTLVRVGLEKRHGLSADAKMVVVHDFNACVDKELSVHQGQEVYVLYKENNWAYVLTEDNKEGFVPLTYLMPWLRSRRHPTPRIPEVTPDLEGSEGATDLFSVSETDSKSSSSRGGPDSLSKISNDSTIAKSYESPRNRFGDSVIGVSHDSVRERTCDSARSNESLPDGMVQPFRTRSFGRYVVVFDFDGGNEDDTSVEQCEVVIVLNMEDPDWYWVRRSTGEEGFVPRTYLCPYPHDLDLSIGNLTGGDRKRTDAKQLRQRRKESTSDVQELVVTYDFSSQSKTHLTVRKGAIVLADFSRQDQCEWVWVYSPDSDSYGYIPQACVQLSGASSV